MAQPQAHHSEGPPQNRTAAQNPSPGSPRCRAPASSSSSSETAERASLDAAKSPTHRRDTHQNADYDDGHKGRRNRPGEERRQIAITEGQAAAQALVEQIAEDDAQHQRSHWEIHLPEDETDYAEDDHHPDIEKPLRQCV